MSEQTPEQAARLRRLLNAVEVDDEERAAELVKTVVCVEGRTFVFAERVEPKDETGRTRRPSTPEEIWLHDEEVRRRTDGIYPSRPDRSEYPCRERGPRR